MRAPGSFAAAAVFLAACELTRDPTPLGPLEEVVAVHAILRAESDTARVLVTRGSSGGAGGPSGIRPVSGADVRITGPSGEILLAEAAPGVGSCFYDFGPADPDSEAVAGPGCYGGTLAAAVRPGERYELRITLPDGGAVRGAAVIPAPASLGAWPAGGARLAARTSADPPGPAAESSFEWALGEDAAMVEFVVAPDTAFAGGEAVAGATCSIAHDLSPERSHGAAGETVLRVWAAICAAPADPRDPASWQPLAWDSIRARVHVAVFDTAYSRYVDEVLLGGGSVARDRAGAGLTGAAGVFGAVAIAELPVLLLVARP